MAGSAEESPQLVVSNNQSHFHLFVHFPHYSAPNPYSPLKAIIQNILLFMLGLPAYQVLNLTTPLGLSDYVITILALITLAIEFTADNQQWTYQNSKRTKKNSTNEWPGSNLTYGVADWKRGFITRGLWAWSRHPNFACEQTFWVCVSASSASVNLNVRCRS